MKFPCTISKTADNTWLARHHGPEAGSVEVRATTRQEVLDKMKNELRYRLELCPCTGETYQHIDIQIIEDATARE
jgi:hypothetical protein